MDNTPGPPLVSPSCLTLDDLVRYFTNAMEGSKAAEVETHLMECEYCRALSDQVADTAQELYERDLAAPLPFGLTFLNEAPESYLGKDLLPKMMSRIERWAGRGAELTVRVFLPKLGGIAAFAVSGMKATLSPSSHFDMEHATVGAFMGGSDGTIRDGELEGPVLEIPGGGRRRARVVVDVGETTRVSVQLDNVPDEIRMPLVAIRSEEPRGTLIKEMTRVESISGEPGMTDLIVDFDLPWPAAEILVVVEPLDE